VLDAIAGGQVHLTIEHTLTSFDETKIGIKGTGTSTSGSGSDGKDTMNESDSDECSEALDELWCSLLHMVMGMITVIRSLSPLPSPASASAGANVNTVIRTTWTPLLLNASLMDKLVARVTPAIVAVKARAAATDNGSGKAPHISPLLYSVADLQMARTSLATHVAPITASASAPAPAAAT
jgi:hypothetical protein